MSVSLFTNKWQFIVFFLIILSIGSVLTVADNTSSSLSLGNLIFDGSLPSGEGTVPIKAVSGKLYQVPVMSPLGIIQILAGTDIIDSYNVGDELISKKGILTLDAINGITDTGDTSWTVYVNDQHLNDYLLPSKDALNTYKIKTGDVLLFIYGNPINPATEAVKSIRVTIGSQPGGEQKNIIAGQSLPTQNQTPAPEPVPEPFVTINPVDVVQTTSTQPVVEETPSPKEPDVTEMPETVRKDSNLPVYDDEETVQDEGSEKSSQTDKDPNLPVNEDEEKSEKTTDQEVTREEDEDRENTNTIEEKDEETQDEKSDTNPPPKTQSNRTSNSGQTVLFDGTRSLPSGSVNVTTDSGMDYDITGKTPLGILQEMFNDGKISSMMVSDRGMDKVGILTVTGIEDYQYGEETWFVQINGVQLKDYLNPATDGLNLKLVNSGDKLTYYYGKADQDASTAQAVIYVTIE